LALLVVSFLQAFQPIFYMNFSSPPIYVSRSANYTLFDLIIPTVLGEEYKLGSSSLCSSLHPPVASSLLSPNLLSTLFSNTLSLLPPKTSETSCAPLRNHRQNYSPVYSNFYVFRKTTRQKTLDWIVANITRIQSRLTFPLKKILIHGSMDLITYSWLRLYDIMQVFFLSLCFASCCVRSTNTYKYPQTQLCLLL
jgi:hypothetical protein